jgi:hypothetical protein
VAAPSRYRPRVRRARVLALFALLSGSAWAKAEAQTPRPAVVFFVPPELEPDTRGALEDALATQLLALPVGLVIEVQDDSASALEQRLDAMKQAATKHKAVAVFWLEVHGSERWFLYAVDAQVQRVVMRPLQTKAGSEATLDTVAVIVRATTDALLHGETLPESAAAPAPATKPKTPWPVVTEQQKSSALRLAAGYFGTMFARQLPWQNGLEVKAEWIWPTGAYLGLGYTFFAAAEFTEPVPPNFLQLTTISFAIERLPLALHAGLRFEVGSFTFAAELGAGIEARKRRTLAPSVPPTKDESRIVYSVCPRLESEYSITSWLRLYAGVGIDFELASYPYVFEVEAGKTPMTILKPFPVRPTFQAGIAIIR